MNENTQIIKKERYEIILKQLRKSETESHVNGVCPNAICTHKSLNQYELMGFKN
jgi:hypothetical protein